VAIRSPSVRFVFSAGSTRRSNSSDTLAEVAQILKRAVALKPTGHHLLEGRSTQDRSMYQIGG